jgi:hypothetical protein
MRFKIGPGSTSETFSRLVRQPRDSGRREGAQLEDVQRAREPMRGNVKPQRVIEFLRQACVLCSAERDPRCRCRRTVQRTSRTGDSKQRYDASAGEAVPT